jgi:hypothetical protein
MKWFKHMTAASRDEKMQLLIAEWGLEGYGAYWILLELLAGVIENQEKDSHQFSIDFVKNLLKFSPKKLKNFMEFLQNQNLFTSEFSQKMITLKNAKMRSIMDESTNRRKNKIGNNSEPTPDQELELELELENDTAKAASFPQNPPQNPPQKKPLPLPLFCEESQPIKTTGGKTEQGLDLVLIRKDGTRQTEIEWLMQNLIHHVRSGRNGKTQLHDGTLAGFCGVHPEANKLLYEWKKLSKPERMAALFTSCLCPTATNELRYALAAVRNKYENYLSYWEAAKQAPDTDREVDLNETQRDTSVFNPKEAGSSNGGGHSANPERVENGQDNGGQPQQFGNSSGIQSAGAGVQLF